MQGSEPVHSGVLHEGPGHGIGELAGDGLGEARDRTALGLHPHGIDDGIGAASLGALTDLADGVVGEVEHLDAMALGHRAALRHGVDAEHPSAQVPSDPRAELTHRAQPDHCQGAVGRHPRVLHGLPGGGEDVAEEEVVLVRQLGAHLHQPEVGVRDPQELGLAAGDLTVELGVAQQRRTRAVLGDLRGLALRGQLLGTHGAAPAGDGERDHHAVAGAHVGDLCTDLLDDAHRLMAYDVTGGHERAEHLVEVEVRAADRGGGDADDRVGGVLEDGVGHGLDAHAFGALPGHCSHDPAFRW